METENKPFAPFSILVHQLQAQHIQVKAPVFFFVGSLAYDEALASIEGGHLALCLPKGHRFADYRWAVRGLRLLLYDTGGMSALGMSRLSYELLKLGAELVCAHSQGNKPDTVDIHALRKDFQDDDRRNKAAIARKYGRTR